MVLMLTCMPSTSLCQTTDVFRRPDKRLTGEKARITPYMAWVTTQWDPKADAPFMPIRDELIGYRVFQGFDKTGKWRKKARDAHASWKRDWKNPQKFFAACSYFLAASGLDLTFSKEKDFQEILTDLNLAWEVFPNPPKSYLFVRMGYLYKGGDGCGHIFGELPYKLLERDPLDLAAVGAAVQELWDESRWERRQGRRGAEFEEFLLKRLAEIKRSRYWRPWAEDLFSAIYHCRALLRTRSRADLQRAVDHNAAAIKSLHPEMDKTPYLKARDLIQSRFQYMKHD
jgi:hypothetical protein